MRVSLNEIKKYVPEAAKDKTSELVELIGSRLVEVEETIDLAPKYKGIYIVKVVECEPIPDTHLHLCQIDTGQRGEGDARKGVPAPGAHATGVGNDYERQDPPLIQVVCGAPNVHKGMLAVWIAPGSVVPQTYGNEDFKLDVRKLRGYESHGMLAGLDELDLGDDHSGIVEIDPSMDFKDRNVQPGDSFAEVFDLNDIILDIENKSLTHRPDTFGLVGFAREVAGILGVKFSIDEDGRNILKVGGGADLRGAVATDTRNSGLSGRAPNDLENISIVITDNKLCPRYSCAIIDMKDADAKDKYLTCDAVFLAKAGMRTVSKIVDVTNVLMLNTGQPLHAFDYDKFVKVGGTKTPKVIVRAAKDGEELQLLDGKTIKCNENDILITSNNVPVALAGAMGGASTEIDASTKRVFLESATFSLYNLRKTQMAHGIFSEAITRFTKGQPAYQTLKVLELAVKNLGGEVVSVADEYPDPVKPAKIKLTVSDINTLLGTDYDMDDINNTLHNVGFSTEGAPAGHAEVTTEHKSASPVTTGASDSVRSGALCVTPPLWRTDIHIKEDIIEEVGRLKGFDNIPQTLPLRPFIGAKNDKMLELKSQIRNILSDTLNAHEILSYSFVNEKLQQTVGEDAKDSYKIVNSISPDLQCIRQTLVPSLLEKTYINLKAGYKDFALYEMNQVSKISYGLNDEKVPVMHHHLALVTTGDYYQAKAILEQFLKKLGIRDLAFKKFEKGLPFFEPLHSAKIGNIELGEIRSGILKKLKIDQPISAFELDLEALLENIPEKSAHIEKLSKFPSVERDLTLKVNVDRDYIDLEQAIKTTLNAESDLKYSLNPASIYQKGTDTKNVSFKISFSNMKKTLTADEISAIMEEVVKSVKTLGAEVV